MSIFCHIYDPVVKLDSSLNENILSVDQLLGTHFVVKGAVFDPSMGYDGYTTIGISDVDLVWNGKYRFTMTNQSDRMVVLSDFKFMWVEHGYTDFHPALRPGQAVELFTIADSYYRQAAWVIRGKYDTYSLPT